MADSIGPFRYKTDNQPIKDTNVKIVSTVFQRSK